MLSSKRAKSFLSPDQIFVTCPNCKNHLSIDTPTFVNNSCLVGYHVFCDFCGLNKADPMRLTVFETCTNFWNNYLKIKQTKIESSMFPNGLADLFFSLKDAKQGKELNNFMLKYYDEIRIETNIRR